MVKLVSDTIDKNDIAALVEWLTQETIPRLTKGELTAELENKWSRKLGTNYSVFVNSGSSSILLTLATLKVTGKLKNLKIVVPALSWVTDVSSPMLLGYDTIMCDCNINDLSCDLDKLETIFKNESPSVFILVSPLGLVPDMERVVNLCKKFDVLLLEDVCESMGSKYSNRYLGTYGLASFFSMYYGHHLSTIEGGFINTDDEELYHNLLMMRSHGWDRDLPTHVQHEKRARYNCTDFDSMYNFYLPGMNLRSTDLQAYIGLRAIEKLDQYSLTRNQNFKVYKSTIKSNELNITEHKDDFVSNFAYPIVSIDREKIVKQLIANSIEVRPLIAGNMANKPMWQEHATVKRNNINLDNCNRIDRYGFYVPNHQDLTGQDIEKITTIING